MAKIKPNQEAVPQDPKPKEPQVAQTPITGVERLKELLDALETMIGIIAKVMALIMAIQQGATKKGIGSGFIPTPQVLKRAQNDLENSIGWFRDVMKQMITDAPDEVNAALGTEPEKKEG